MQHKNSVPFGMLFEETLDSPSQNLKPLYDPIKGLSYINDPNGICVPYVLFDLHYHFLQPTMTAKQQETTNPKPPPKPSPFPTETVTKSQETTE